MFWGTIIIVIGMIMLLKNLGIITTGVWSVLWPLLLIIFGISLLTKKGRQRAYFYSFKDKNESKKDFTDYDVR